MAGMRLTSALGALFLSATTAFGALSATFNSAYDGGISANGYTASGALTLTLNFAPAPGQQLLLVNNTAASAISGTFTGLAEGATRTATYGGNTFTFRISYLGGTGNDITLTRVAGPGQVTSSNNYLWSNFAGSTGGAGSQDGIGIAARFNTPGGVAIDSTGNVYVADSGNHTIRKLTPAGVVATLAGTTGFAGSADGTGNAAGFNSPSGVAVDSMGNIYVADRINHTIRKVTPAGVVTTLAGRTGTSGNTDGTGSNARFSSPYGVTVDSSGNIYVADRDNHTIRKVTLGGVVTTLAGAAGTSGTADGTGSDARFSYPAGVAVDGSGIVYVADSVNHTIRKVTPAGVVTTLAGTAGSSGSTNGTGSAARFSFPTGVAVDGSGNVYVADSNHTIRKVTSAGVVSTLAGSAGSSWSTDGSGSAARFNNPFGVAVDGSGNVYVSDRSNHTIRRLIPAIVLSTSAGTATISGNVDGTGSAARFNAPAGIAADGSGNLYVADTINHTIRKVTPAGEVTTLAGSAGISGSTDFWSGPSARFYSPRGLAVDKWGRIIVADTDNSTIRIITGSSGQVSTLAGQARTYGFQNGTGSLALFYRPSGVAVDSEGNVYVADQGNHAIRKITPAGVVTTLAGWPSYGGNGSADGTGSSARFNSPSGVALDSSGNIYVADRDNHTIRKVNLGGVVTTLAGTAGYSGSSDGTGSAARFSSPDGVSVDAAGNIYVADKGNHTIRKVTPAGVVTTLTGAAGSSGSANGSGSLARFNSPSGVAVGAAGEVYVADSGNHTIRSGVPAGEVTTFAGAVVVNSGRGSADGSGSTASFYSPDGVAMDSFGNVYVADRLNHTIRKVTPAGVVTTLAGTARSSGSTNSTGSAARFSSPSGVAVDSSGNVYVADTGNHTIRRVTPAGVVTTLAGTAGSIGSTDGTGSAARFYRPGGIALDSAGNLYVADTSNHNIRKVTTAGVVTTFAGGWGQSYYGDRDGTGSTARFRSPEGVAVDATGNVYVVDTGNHTIRKVTPAGVVTTLAGSAGTSGSADGTGSIARFNSPSGVAVDSSGNIFVADRTNNKIRKVNPAGLVTTLAGNVSSIGYNAEYGSYGNVKIGSIEDVAVSADGRVFATTPSQNRLIRGEPAGFQPVLTQGSASRFGAATLTGTVNPNGFQTTATFEYGLTTAYGNTVSVILSPSDGTSAQNVSAELTALSVGTLYHYRLTATNIDGTARTNGGTFTTTLLSETSHAPVGQGFTYQIISTSELPVTFRATGLPAGLTLDPVTGIISGTVTEAGTYTVTTTVANAAEESSATLTLVVSASALPFLGDTGTIQACLGQGLDYSFLAANSPTASGVLGLPPGLWQHDYNSDGVVDGIFGTPLVAGYFPVTFWAENALGRCTRSAIIRVNKPAVTTSAQMFEGLDVRAVTKDRQGNTFLGARLNGSVVLGGTTYTAVNGNVDGFIIKMSPTGQVLWCFQLTGDRGCDLENLAVDSSGNVIACGGIDPYSSTFAGVAVSGQTFFVVKLTTAGVRSWTRVEGSGIHYINGVTNAGYCNAMAVDAANNIWVGGQLYGSIDFSNGSTLTSSAPNTYYYNGFVAGFSSTGTVLTPRLFSSTNVSYINSLATAPDGSVVVAGDFSDNLTVPGSGSAPNASITLTSPDGNASRSFVACIGGATTNAAYWAKQIPDGSLFMRNCMVADSTGGLYVTGYGSPTVGTLPANSIALPEMPNGDGFLMRLSASATYGLGWIKSLPATGTLTSDGNNALYLEGVSPSRRFDDIEYSGNSRRYLAKISTSGSVSWVRDSVAYQGSDQPCIAADSDGNLAITAASDGSEALSIGDQSVTGSGTGLFLLGNAPSSGAAPVITSPLQVPVVGGRPLTYQIEASNIPTSYWVSDLPEGVHFDESTGVITATPTEAGTYTSTIWAMNAAGYGSATLTVTVSPNPDPQITSPATATATVGQPFSYQITATNSPTSFAAHGFVTFDALPDGLTFNATTGLIQGSPVLAGQMRFFVKAFNATGWDARIVNVTVAGNPAITPPVVQSDSIAVTIDQPLSYQIQATGAVRYDWTTVGAWPTGLRFDRATGLFSGTLTTAGTYQITIQGINGGGVTSALLQLTVNPATGGSGSIASWRQQHFGSDQNSGNAADLAAPDGDGIPNLVKYALLMTPGQNGSARLPQAAMTGTSGSRRLTLTFQRDPSRSDVTIVVEAQSGLGGTWSEIARSTNGAGFTGSAAVSETSAAGGAKSVTVQDVQVDASRRFMRVRVER